MRHLKEKTRKVMNRLNIAMLTLHLPQKGENSGVDYQVHYLSNMLVSFGHKVTVFSLSDKPEDAIYNVNKIGIPQRAGRNNLMRAILYPFYLRLQNYDGYDIIHSHGNDFLFYKSKKIVIRTFYGTALMEAIFAKSWGRKIYQSIWYGLEFLSGINAKYSIGISEGTKKYLPFIKEVIPCGVDMELFKKKYRKSKKASILFIGTIQGRKRGKFLCSVFRRKIIIKYPKCELWLIADEPINGRNIQYFGRVSSNELVYLYNKAWILCSVSLYEGFGVPLIEAMACGTPVISSPNRGAIEVLKNGRYGAILNDNKISEGILSLLGNERRREKMSAKGLEYVRKFSFFNIAKRYEKAYYRLREIRELRNDEQK